METGHKMLGKDRLFPCPGSWARKSLFLWCVKLKDWDNKREKRGSRGIILKMLPSSCFPPFGVCLRCAVLGR